LTNLSNDVVDHPLPLWIMFTETIDCRQASQPAVAGNVPGNSANPMRDRTVATHALQAMITGPGETARKSGEKNASSC